MLGCWDVGMLGCGSWMKSQLPRAELLQALAKDFAGGFGFAPLSPEYDQIPFRHCTRPSLLRQPAEDFGTRFDSLFEQFFEFAEPDETPSHDFALGVVVPDFVIFPEPPSRLVGLLSGPGADEADLFVPERCAILPDTALHHENCSEPFHTPEFTVTGAG